MIKKTMLAFLDKPVATEMKKLEVLLKSFSRSLNDAFTREFSQCGIAQNEVVRLRTRSYSACCDIIHQLKAAFMFEGDMARLIACIRDFQEHLKDLYPKFNIPLSYIVPLNFDNNTELPEEEETTERMMEEEPAFEFDEELELVEFVLECQANQELIGRSIGEFFRILLEKAQGVQATLESEMQRRKDLEAAAQSKSAAAAQSTEELQKCKTMYEASIKELETQVKRQERRAGDLRQGMLDVMMILGARINRDVTDEELMSAALAACTNRLSKECEACVRKDEDKENLKKQILERDEKIRELEVIENEFVEYKKSVSGMSADLEIVEELKERERKLCDILHVESAGIVAETERIHGEYETALADMKGIESGESLIQVTRNICSSYLETKDVLCSALSDEESGNLRDMAEKVVEMLKTKESDKVHDALNEIVKSESTDLETHAKLCVESYKNALNGTSQYRRVLDVLQIRNGEDVFSVLDERLKRYNSFVARVCENVSKITGTKQEQTEEYVFSELTSIANQMKSNHTSLVNLQRTCSNVEACLARLCGVSPGKKPVGDSIEAMLKSLEQQKAPSLLQIEKKLADILNVERVPERDATKRVMDLLDLVSVRISEPRKGLETIASVTIKNGTFEKVDTKTLVSRILKALTPPPKPATTTTGVHGLDKMFADVFALVPVTSRTDYKEYIPEICAAFVTLHNSVMALKPFASTLNNIFTQFDCKFTSFHPGSESYKFLRSQVFALHTALNGLVPSKINSLVFLVLSRFIALFSSFMTAISSASFDPASEKMQEEFYRLEQENQAQRHA